MSEDHYKVEKHNIPITHGHPGETPFLAKDFLEEEGILGYMGSVDAVIAAKGLSRRPSLKT